MPSALIFQVLQQTQSLQYHLADLPSDLIPYELEYVEKVSMGADINSVNILGKYRYGAEGFSVDTLVTLRNMVWIRTSDLNAPDPMIAAYRFDLENELAFTLVQLNRPNIKALYARTKYTPDALRKLSEAGKGEGEGSLRRQKQLGHLGEINTDWFLSRDRNPNYHFPYVRSTVGFLSTFVFSSRQYLRSANPHGGRFLFNISLAGVRLKSLPDPSVIPVVYESEPWQDGSRCVLFADNRVRFVGPSEWARTTDFLRLKLPRYGRPLPSNTGWSLLKETLPKSVDAIER